MKEKLTIRENDSLTIYVKKSKSNEIKENYSLFGWQVVSEAENRRYEDILDITFSRPHKISHKDELQLYQVYMEERINHQVKLERNQRSKTTAFGLCFGVFGVALFVMGILSCCGVVSMFGVIPSLVMSVLGIAVLIVGGIFVPKILKKEKSIFEINNKKINQEINVIKNKVLSLNGGKNNEK